MVKVVVTPANHVASWGRLFYFLRSPLPNPSRANQVRFPHQPPGRRLGRISGHTNPRTRRRPQPHHRHPHRYAPPQPPPVRHHHTIPYFVQRHRLHGRFQRRAPRRARPGLPLLLLIGQLRRADARRRLALVPRGVKPHHYPCRTARRGVGWRLRRGESALGLDPAWRRVHRHGQQLRGAACDGALPARCQRYCVFRACGWPDPCLTADVWQDSVVAVDVASGAVRWVH